MMWCTDDLDECMWFLSDTGWTVRDCEGTTTIGYCEITPNVTRHLGFKPYIRVSARKKVYVGDLFTAVVVAWLGSADRSVFDRVKDLRGSGDDERVTGKAVTLKGADVNESADKLLDEVPSGARIVRLDVRETRGDFVWTIYWQELNDGEA